MTTLPVDALGSVNNYGHATLYGLYVPGTCTAAAVLYLRVVGARPLRTRGYVSTYASLRTHLYRYPLYVHREYSMLYVEDRLQ